MRRVIEEGRTALRGLRSATSDARRSCAGVCGHPAGVRRRRVTPTYRVIIEGQPRALAADIRDEVYRIVREGARQRLSPLRRRARRNWSSSTHPAGCTCSCATMAGESTRWCREMGTEGHWGLPGMRERAERIGAPVEGIDAAAAAGTEVELTIPRPLSRSGRARTGAEADGERGSSAARLARRRKTTRRGHRERQPRIRVFSVDDHPLLREGIAAVVNSQPTW